MLLKSFLHAKIDIQDEKRSLDFYCNKLQLKQIVRYQLSDESAIIQLSPNGSPPGIELWCEKPFKGFNNDRLHIAFEVDHVVDVVRRLKAEGVSIAEEPFRKGHEIIAFLRDPDGYLIELNEDTTEKE